MTATFTLDDRFSGHVHGDLLLVVVDDGGLGHRRRPPMRPG